MGDTKPGLLQHPGDIRAADMFLDSLGIAPQTGSLSALGDLSLAFSRLPYENVSKLLKTAQPGNPELWRRHPLEVMEDHFAHGLGGTCYSLTNSLRAILDRLGYATRPVSADMAFGTNRHCALLVFQGGQLCLLDPGYLICEPVPLPETETRLQTPRGTLILRANRLTGGHDLFSEGKEGLKFRYHLHPEPDTEQGFIQKWRDSFSWPSMNQLVITRYTDEGQIYLHNRHMRVIADRNVEKRDLDENLAIQAADAFGIDPDKIAGARELLNARRPKRKL